MEEIKTHAIYVQGDWNDGDYVYRDENITDIELEIVQKMVAYFKQYGRNYHPKGLKLVNYSWCVGSFYASELSKYVTLDEFLIFDDMVPHGPEGVSIHSIESIVVIPIQQVTRLL